MRKNEKIIWPIILLRENGNIYVLMANLDTERYFSSLFIENFSL